jgi:hypothetical protein
LCFGDGQGRDLFFQGVKASRFIIGAPAMALVWAAGVTACVCGCERVEDFMSRQWEGLRDFVIHE